MGRGAATILTSHGNSNLNCRQASSSANNYAMMANRRSWRASKCPKSNWARLNGELAATEIKRIWWWQSKFDLWFKESTYLSTSMCQAPRRSASSSKTTSIGTTLAKPWESREQMPAREPSNSTWLFGRRSPCSCNLAQNTKMTLRFSSLTSEKATLG